MAYAAVISLKLKIERFMDHSQITKPAYKLLIQLGDVLKRLDVSSQVNYYQHGQIIDRNAIDSLDAEIRDEVWKLEDAVKSFALNLSLPPSDACQLAHTNGCLPIDAKSLEQEMDLFSKRVNKLKEEYIKELDDHKPEPLFPEEEEEDIGGKKSTKTVGLSDQFEEIMNELLDRNFYCDSVSLWGMAGIGKTHLARDVYEHPTIIENFDYRVWVTIGRKYHVNNLLGDILAQMEQKPRHLYNKEEDIDLLERLHDMVRGRRCLIVFDDVWSSAIDEYFIRPMALSRIRFLLTTRLEKVAGFSYQIRFMNNEESWDLLLQNVFADRDKSSSFLPHELEKLGRKIAANCEGLPLLILAVAEILAGYEKTPEYWMKVASRKTTTFIDAYDKIANVLLLSYDYLPQQSKACFLYMGVFPQSCEIPVPKLINLYTVEDFLEPDRSITLEAFAMDCLKKLVSSSLVIVCKKSCYLFDIIKSCKLHGAYWYLCVKEARRTKFFHVLNKLSDCSEDHFKSRRLSFQNNTLFGIKEVYDSMAATSSTTSSLLCTGEDHEYPVPICLKNRMLLEVFDALSIRFYEFPEEVTKLLLLRYLAITYNGKLPCSISNLEYLQFLTVRQHHNVILLRDPTCLPPEIWELQDLTYLRIVGSNLRGPIDDAFLPNLKTLHINAHSCTKDVFEGFPFLRKLGIKIELQPNPAAEPLGCFEHAWLLDDLEELKCVVVNPHLSCHQVVAEPHHLLHLPRSLTKLSLSSLGYSWKHMSAIGSLPQLKVLKVQHYAFQGAEWDPQVGEFQSLEFLLLEDIDLVHWIVDDEDCFPQLRSLLIRHCYKLKEIPQRIGALEDLYTIEVVDCSSSVTASAQKIVDRKQEDEDLDSIQAVINSSWNL